MRIQIRVYAAEDFGKKRKEIELYRQAVFVRGHQVGFERAERAFVRLAVLVAEFVPTGPPPRAQHVEASVLNLGHVAVPDEHVGMVEIEALDFARHVRGSNDSERMAVKFKEIVIDRQVRAGAQKLGVANPEA